MDENREKELTARFPQILRDMGGDPKSTCMAWGLECGPGWFGLLSSALEKIQLVCDLSTQAGVPVQLVANQVKEKFGTLRFYYSVEGGSPVVVGVLEDIVSAAENESSRTCEDTGDRGDLCIRGGWYRTLCRTQARQEGYRACDEGVEEYWKELDSAPAESQASPPSTPSTAAV